MKPSTPYFRFLTVLFALIPTSLSALPSGLETVAVEGGTFRSSVSPASAPLQLTAASLEMTTTAVTQAVYRKVTGTNPSLHQELPADATSPVENLSWYEAVAFANNVSTFDGLQPVYTIDGTTVSADLSKNGWRLPSALEYEWARRGGRLAQGYGDFAGVYERDADKATWWLRSTLKLPKTTQGRPQPVATLLPNELGLYDMVGNVMTWTNDAAWGARAGQRIVLGAAFDGIRFFALNQQYAVDASSKQAQLGLRLVRWGKYPAPTPVKPAPEPLIEALERAGSDAAKLSAAAALSGAVFVTDSAQVELKNIASSDQNQTWSVSVVSKDPAVPFAGPVSIDVRYSPDPEALTKDLLAVVKAGILRAHLVYKVTRRAGGYRTTVVSVEFGVKVSGALQPLVSAYYADLKQAQWGFSAGRRTQPSAVDLVDTEVVPAGGGLPALVVGTTLVTREQYQQALPSEPVARADQVPATKISWLKAIEYCNALSRLQGLQPVYLVAGTEVEADATRNGWRLPTLAEFDRLRGALPTNWDSSVWHAPNANRSLQFVAQKKPNEFGLYDTLGMVTVWTDDSVFRDNKWLRSQAGLAATDEVEDLRTAANPYLFDDGASDLYSGFRVVRRDGPASPPPVTAVTGTKALPDPDAAIALVEQTSVTRKGFVKALFDLQEARFVVRPDKVTVSVGAFDRVAKSWPLAVTSSDPAVPFRQTVTYSLLGTPDLAAAFLAIDTLRKAGQLKAQLKYSYWRLAPGQYQLRVTAVELGRENAGTFQVLANVPTAGVWTFTAGQRKTPQGQLLAEEVAVAGGTFADQKRQVTVSSFVMTRDLVTQGVYELVTGTNPSLGVAGSAGSDQPVNRVSWMAALEFCNRLSLMQGLEPVYRITNSRYQPPGIKPSNVIVVQDLTKSGWRLPTSWEYLWAAKTSAGSLRDITGRLAQLMGDFFTSREATVDALDPKGPGFDLENEGGLYTRGYPRADSYGIIWPEKVNELVGFRLVRRGALFPVPPRIGVAATVAPAPAPAPTIAPEAVATAQPAPAPIKLPAVPGKPYPLDLSGAFNVANAIVKERVGPVTDGLDGKGTSFSSFFLGAPVNWLGQSFALGPVGGPSAMAAQGQTLALPAGKFGSLLLLASQVGDALAAQSFTVVYGDGTKQVFSQAFSPWDKSQKLPNEAVAVSMGYRVAGGTKRDVTPSFLYGYTLKLDSQKTVASFTVPTAPSLKIFALTLMP